MSIFDKHGFWLFGNNGTMDEELQEEEHQEELCRLMERYQAYQGVIREQSYVLRGSVIRCQYGTRSVFLDLPEDYGIVQGRFRFPVMTCHDCMPDNIYDFGSCLCPESNYSGRLPMTAASRPDGKTAIKAKENIFPHICVPLINVDQGWKQIDGDVLIDAGQKGYAPMLLDDAVLVCQYGGIIRILEVPADENGQTEEEKKDKKLVEWLIKIEAPFSDRDYIMESINGKKKRIAIKPHSAGDGYVTVGNGHLIQSDEDAERFGFQTGKKQSIDEVNESIQKQLKEYGDNLDNPAILTVEEAGILLEEDLAEYRETAEDFMEETGLEFSKNEKDAITSLVYNGNNAYSEDNLLYYFLRKDKEGAMEVLQKADEEKWYTGREGTLRRRLMEYNMFFNNDYTFYDLKELDKLKSAVGWKE